MAISYDLIRGHTDAIILARLLQKDSYGYEINKEILELTDDTFEIKEATLYTAFRRMEKSGYIQSYWGEEGVGARRKYYTLTTLGKKAYKQALEDWEKTQTLIAKLLV